MTIFVLVVTIIEHIQYLLCHHDCVVVEGLGAFVACRRPAYIDADLARFMPPGRDLGFNSVLVHDDGLLAGSIARRENVGYDVAKSIIERDVELIRNRMEVGSVFCIPRIGELSMSRTGTIEFVPVADDDAMFGASLDKLPVVSLPSVEIASKQESRVNILEVAPRGWRQRTASALKYAASVAILLGLGFVASTPLVVDKENVDFASISIPQVSASSNAFVYNDGDDDGRALFIRKPAEDTAAFGDIKKQEKDYGYYLIVGSCASRSEAERFMSRMGDERMRVVRGDGRYRVYVAAGDTYSGMYSYRMSDQQLLEKYPDAWIYHRK